MLQVNVLSNDLLSCLLLSQPVECAKINRTGEGEAGGSEKSVPHLGIVSSDSYYQVVFPECAKKTVFSPR
jgi:hypothetical protein